MNQKDFTARCHAYGLDKQEGGRVERGSVDFRAKHVVAFSIVLDVPEDWWTDADLDRLLWAGAAGDPAKRFAGLAKQAFRPLGELPESPPGEGDDEGAADEGR